jgi:hypothetical protein
VQTEIRLENRAGCVACSKTVQALNLVDFLRHVLFEPNFTLRRDLGT